ncbi:phosphonate ABC transporter, permease protein PhnE [Spiribacter vilamensis]|uniref:Phosphonate transport system permease protein n=1 Tax=Spiribacter vilamensis TaxID=531306 RepID=A0A4Q8D180_9GAMM|nr:phosphonate ABC transporter, permease protein PhnE [Spiribacter vilamensis]RZU99073.1 phosphonate transport system permease protein [Spiribacter vilamensis]TVO61929.1 phosphonate ABC transporter, permease protein PhnE [Spiribacter vilamensis]
MDRSQSNSDLTPPRRFRRPSPFGLIIMVVFLAFLVQGVLVMEITPARLASGAVNLVHFVGRALPPAMNDLDVIFWAMLETLYIALVGVTAGVILSVPFAFLAARNTTPNVIVRVITRFLVAAMRTIPDLIWALIFVVAVGLGPLAGVLAIVMDTVGFAARFFSERIEEVHPGPSEALASTGARRLSVIGGAIMPETLASMTATSLFSVEKALRSAVTLGLVGAGGIGVELTAAMQLYNYDEALTIILIILVCVLGFEQLSSAIRKRVI